MGKTLEGFECLNCSRTVLNVNTDVICRCYACCEDLDKSMDLEGIEDTDESFKRVKCDSCTFTAAFVPDDISNRDIPEFINCCMTCGTTAWDDTKQKTDDPNLRTDTETGREMRNME